MLNLSAVIPKLEKLAEQFLDESLPSELHPSAFEAFDPSLYERDDLERGKLAWHARVLDEYRSMVAFTSLLQDATQLGLSFDALTCLQRLVRDETRHVELCKRMHIALGGSAMIEGIPNWSITPPDLPPVHRIYHQVIGSLCVGETMSVAMIRAVRNATKDPLAKALMTSLLRDESFHSRLGWNLLEFFHQRDPQGVQGFIEQNAPSYIAAAKQVTIADPEAKEPPFNSFGHLPSSARTAAALKCVEEDIIKPFENMGFIITAEEPVKTVA